MKVTHIFSKSSRQHVVRFTDFIVNFIAVDSKIEHQIIIQPERKSDCYAELPESDVKITINSSVTDILATIDQASCSHFVIFHGLYDRKLINRLVFHSSKLKFVAWFIWGADLYAYPKKRIKRLVNSFCRKFVFPRIGVKVGIPGDYKALKDTYGCKRMNFMRSYFQPGFI